MYLPNGRMAFTKGMDLETVSRSICEKRDKNHIIVAKNVIKITKFAIFIAVPALCL